MSGKLKEKVALVTGAGRGLGRAVSITFAEEGIAGLMLFARTERELDETTGLCRALGVDSQAVAGDITNPTAVTSAVEGALKRFGRIDVLVNAAATLGPIGPLTDVGAGDWLRTVEVNLGGTMRICKEVLPSMIRRRVGSIINFAGGGATGPFPRFSAYAASKVAVVRFTETLALEVSEHGIRVNALAPGFVDTSMHNRVLEAGTRGGDHYRRVTAARESGTGLVSIDLPARLAVYLASDESRLLTGRLISAPYDPWSAWDEPALRRLLDTPWYTLRRIDPLTIRAMKEGEP